VSCSGVLFFTLFFLQCHCFVVFSGDVFDWAGSWYVVDGGITKVAPGIGLGLGEGCICDICRLGKFSVAYLLLNLYSVRLGATPIYAGDLFLPHVSTL